MANDTRDDKPGYIILMGSGETSPSIRKVYDWLFQKSGPSIDVAILETPAGFEPNSDYVAGQIGLYLENHLQNYRPQIHIVPARKRGTPFSPDDPALVKPMYGSNVLLIGPGSPTYAARQLKDSVAWHTLQVRHRQGASLILASATTIASSVHALPVYEIYKVGQDLHWQNGLDFFRPFGLSLIFIPHWNNNDGGDILDTSRCYVGRDRYNQLCAMLSSNHVADHHDTHQDHTIVGLDENTALVVDPANAQCHVMGSGGIVIIRSQTERTFANGDSFSMSELGPFRLPLGAEGIPGEIWQKTQEGVQKATEEKAQQATPSDDVLKLLSQRIEARAKKDWAASDTLRDQIAASGWIVKDTSEGPILEPVTP